MNNHVIQLNGTDLYYGKVNGNLKWTGLENAKRFGKLKIAKGVIIILRNHGISACVVDDIDPGDLFHKFHKLAKSVAFKFVRRGVPLTDLIDYAESWLGILIMEQWNKCDLDKMARTTWIYRGIYWHLQTHIHQVLIRRETSLLDFDTDQASWCAKPNHLEILTQEISKDAKFIIDLIRGDLERSMEVFKLPHYDRLFKEYLIVEHSWTWKRIQLVWSELQDIFK